MNRLLGHEEKNWALRLFACDRLILGLPLALCFALWTTSTQMLVMTSQRDGGRTVACQYFTGTGVVKWQYSGAGRQDCPLVRRG
jgi:hypothetical protein